jgi:hypothetical protein
MPNTKDLTLNNVPVTYEALDSVVNQLAEEKRKEIIQEFLLVTHKLIGNIDLPRKITLMWVLLNLNTAVEFIKEIITLIRKFKNTSNVQAVVY